VLWLQVAAGGLIILVGTIAKLDTKAGDKVAAKWVVAGAFVKWIQGDGWWLFPTVLLLSGLLGLLRKLTGPPWVWGTVHHYLDVFAEDCFFGESSDPLHHHRVTLFRRVRWRWSWCKYPWSGWVVAVERSGHTTRDHISSFRAPDDADQAEGIAGKAWTTRGVIRISNLPDLQADPTRAAAKAYALATHISEVAAHRRRPRSRSLCGIPIEVKNKRWGVLVLDSRSPEGIKSDSELLYRPVAKFLGKLLERL